MQSIHNTIPSEGNASGLHLMDEVSNHCEIGQSRLLELPAEIREAIFEFALRSEFPIVAFRLDDYQREGYEEATQPPLTCVNRQIRQECLPIFYGGNDIVFHTAESRMIETKRWLKRNEANLPSLRRVSLWVRYVNLTNDPSSSNGAISVSLKRLKGEDLWKVATTWEWITVTRMPCALESDVRFLMGELKRILAAEPDAMFNAERFMGMITDLRMLYVKEKMS